MGSLNGSLKGAATKIGVTFEEWEERRASGQLWCYCCRKWLDVRRFGADKSRSNGLSSACKECVSYKATACRYGITIDEARQLRSGVEQCEICGRKCKLEVDHDHETGNVRGLLCGRCNKVIGMFADSQELLASAIEYLKR